MIMNAAVAMNMNNCIFYLSIKNDWSDPLLDNHCLDYEVAVLSNTLQSKTIEFFSLKIIMIILDNYQKSF